MKINLDDLSPQIRKLNPALFGAPVGEVEASKPKPTPAQALGCGASPQAGCAKSVVISLVAYRHRLLDSDNDVASQKFLRDAIAESLGVDDGDQRTHWQYAQIHTTGEEGTAVKIEMFV